MQYFFYKNLDLLIHDLIDKDIGKRTPVNQPFGFWNVWLIDNFGITKHPYIQPLAKEFLKSFLSISLYICNSINISNHLLLLLCVSLIGRHPVRMHVTLVNLSKSSINKASLVSHTKLPALCKPCFDRYYRVIDISTYNIEYYFRQPTLYTYCTHISSANM